MMEVTPHLKSVLKNYQHSATKSLQGPGGLTLVAEAAASPDLKEDEFLQPVPFPIQQLPILTAADTSCSERTETILEGETISCFVVGGEKRLCLPQILNSVLREFSLMQINQECDRLQIYCSRCTPEQLNVLKNQGILPAAAPSCGLITKTDAERLCSALLHPQTTVAIAPRKGSLTFHIYHRCFGKCRGLCTPEMYTTKGARCVECLECHGAFSPQQFVCHVHGDTENRTVHWGFDSKNWRAYVQVCRDQLDWELYGKYLDEMGEMYDGKLAFATPPPPPPVAPSVENSLKRKQVPLDLDMKQPPHQQTDLPHSKRPRPGAGFDEYFGRFPYNLHQVQQIYAALDPLYVQCVHSMAAVAAAANHHRPSAFKPVPQCLEKTRGKGQLNNPDVCFQPNVALAAAPRKARWLNAVEEGVKSERSEEDVAVVDSTVSVVQSTGNIARYNSEIELSTDTEDSASEASSDHYVQKLEDLLKSVDCDTRQSVLAIFRRTAKEHEALLLESRSKDSRIAELESKLSEIESELSSLRRETTVNGCREESPETPKTATSGEEDERLAGNDGGEEKKDEMKPAVVVNGSGSNCNSGSGSSIIVKSVIASIETNKAIIVQGGE